MKSDLAKALLSFFLSFFHPLYFSFGWMNSGRAALFNEHSSATFSHFSFPHAEALRQTWTLSNSNMIKLRKNVLGFIKRWVSCSSGSEMWRLLDPTEREMETETPTPTSQVARKGLRLWREAVLLQTKPGLQASLFQGLPRKTTWF